MFSSQILKIFPELTYRQPMLVRKLKVFYNAHGEEDTYYACPRCDVTMEREFLGFCHRCGQRLDWSKHAQVKVVYPCGKRRKARA